MLPNAYATTKRFAVNFCAFADSMMRQTEETTRTTPLENSCCLHRLPWHPGPLMLRVITGAHLNLAEGNTHLGETTLCFVPGPRVLNAQARRHLWRTASLIVAREVEASLIRRGFSLRHLHPRTPLKLGFMISTTEVYTGKGRENKPIGLPLALNAEYVAVVFFVISRFC